MNDFTFVLGALAIIMLGIALYDGLRGKKKESNESPRPAYGLADLQKDFTQAIEELSEETLTIYAAASFEDALARVMYFADERSLRYIERLNAEDMQMAFTLAKQGLLSQEMDTL